MKAVVTGVAGFIGSHLAARLLAEGHIVRGIDAMRPYYDVDQKRENLDSFDGHEGFSFLECEIADPEARRAIAAADVVFHLAAQPGVRLSWSASFGQYVHDNVLATQVLLEQLRESPGTRFVNASSSSVYGSAERYPCVETDRLVPHSPYGVTKLTSEQLCEVYAANWGVASISLRFFTVYGPRQRPDMAMHRLIHAALSGSPFDLYGDGSAIRDFTYVDDVVAALVEAGRTEAQGAIPINVAGGSEATLNEVIELVSQSTGCPVPIRRQASQKGDVARTGGSIERAQTLLGWAPSVPLREGIEQQVQWHLSRRLRNGVVAAG